METMNLVWLGEQREKKAREADLLARRHTSTYHIFQLNMLKDWISAVKEDRREVGDSPAIRENLEAILDIAKGCTKIHPAADRLVPIVHYELGDYYAQKTDKERQLYNAYAGSPYQLNEQKERIRDHYHSAMSHLNQGLRTDKNALRIAEVYHQMSRFARRTDEVLDLDGIFRIYARISYDKVKWLMHHSDYSEKYPERIEGLLAKIAQDNP